MADTRADYRAATSLTFEQAKGKVGTRGLAASLALAGGYLDGFTYVGHGHVFANAMTGNVVLLGINCLAGSWDTAVHHLTAILAFLMGTCVAESLQMNPRRRGVSAPYTAVLLLEISILAVLSLLPWTTPDSLFTTSIAFAASVQVQTFREVDGYSYSSTFTTGNLRTLTEAAFTWLFEFREPKRASKARTFALICTAFFVGAASGGYATRLFGNRALWGDIGVLAWIALVVRVRLDSSRPLAT